MILYPKRSWNIFFGEDIKKVRRKNGGGPPQIANKVLPDQMKFHNNKHSVQQGDPAISRNIESMALRIEERRSVPLRMHDPFQRNSAAKLLVQDNAETKRSVERSINGVQ
jgi:hypothetical protein